MKLERYKFYQALGAYVNETASHVTTVINCTQHVAQYGVQSYRAGPITPKPISDKASPTAKCVICCNTTALTESLGSSVHSSTA